MAEEMINLETSAPIGAMNSIKIATKKLFSNFDNIFKLSMPALIVALGTLIMTLPAILLTNIFHSIAILLIGLVVFCYGFWRYLIGSVAVSYLAKDIFENKEVKTAKDYYSYVSYHSKSYVKYWLWIALGWLVFILYSILLLTLTIAKIAPQSSVFAAIMNVLGYLVLVPIMIGFFQVSLFSWAYGDKEKPLNRIIEAVNVTFKNFFEVLLVSIAFWFITFVISFIPYLLVNVITLYFSYIQVQQDVILAIATPISGLISLITSYIYYFIFTRYYFELVKKG